MLYTVVIVSHDHEAEIMGNLVREGTAITIERISLQELLEEKRWCCYEFPLGLPSPSLAPLTSDDR